KFQALLLGDYFLQNLPHDQFVRNPKHAEIAAIREEFAKHKSRFSDFSKDASLTKSQRNNARRWVSNSLLHSIDSSIELSDLQSALRLIEAEESAIIEADHFMANPLFLYLKGRV